MEQIAKIRDDVDLILWDLIGPNPFAPEDLDSIISTVVLTIRQFDKKFPRSQLRTIVGHHIMCKYNVRFTYDHASEPPRQVITKKPESSSSSASDDMSFGDLDMGASVEEPVVACYINSEIDNVQTDINRASDLISHRHDYGDKKYTEKKYIRRRDRIVEIKKIPQPVQKSDEWLAQRKQCITATGVSTALDQDPYSHPAKFLLEKCERGLPFKENENTHHGCKYEEIGAMFYGYRNNVDVADYGLLQHSKYPFVGASPDGICEKTSKDGSGMSKIVGRLLEIKFPKTREILTKGDLDGDICPHQYYLQCLTQMFVTEMDECDFLQCKIEEYSCYDDFVQDSQDKIPGLSKSSNLEKGCIIQLSPKHLINVDEKLCLFKSAYLYPPKLHMTIPETEKWIAHEVINFGDNDLSKDFMIDKVIYWKLTKVTCHLVKKDDEFMMNALPQLKQFWDYVEFYREHTDKLDELEAFVKEVGDDKTQLIFEKINKDFLKVNKKSKYTPLYPEVNPWRAKFIKKKEAYRNQWRRK